VDWWWIGIGKLVSASSWQQVLLGEYSGNGFIVTDERQMVKRKDWK